LLRHAAASSLRKGDAAAKYSAPQIEQLLVNEEVGQRFLYLMHNKIFYFWIK
jgi:hypothetical protein